MIRTIAHKSHDCDDHLSRPWHTQQSKARLGKREEEMNPRDRCRFHLIHEANGDRVSAWSSVAVTCVAKKLPKKGRLNTHHNSTATTFEEEEMTSNY